MGRKSKPVQIKSRVCVCSVNEESRMYEIKQLNEEQKETVSLYLTVNAWQCMYSDAGYKISLSDAKRLKNFL